MPSGEFKHKSVGTEYSQAEFEAVDRHQFDGQATGDMLIATSSTQPSKLAIGNSGDVLRVVSGLPAWVDLKTVLDYGLAFYGVVTAVTDSTHFKVSALADIGINFKPTTGAAYEIYVIEADAAAPEGEQTPVVAFTVGGDGTFQHAAFTQLIEVGDGVLLINPLLASLGTKATAAATGAVSTAKFMMAYQKQVVTLLLNGTYGLSNLKTLIDAIQTDVGDPTGETLVSISAKIGDIARSLDVIIGARWDSSGDLGTDIAQLLTYTDILDDGTNGLANIKSLIDTLTGYVTTEIADILTDTGTTIPGTITTLQTAVTNIQGDLDNATDGLGALKDLIDAIQVDLGDKDDAAVVGFPGSNAAIPILKGLQIWQGGFVYADITGYTDTKNFASTTLAAFETGFFNDWTLFLAKKDDGTGNTPQGARSAIDTFTTSSGAIVLKSALPSAGAVGDHIILVHPVLLDAWNLRGGVGGVADILENQSAELDTARGTSGAVSVDGGEDDVYNESSDNEFVLQELRVDLNNMAEGDTITFKVYTTEGGTERKISEDAANTFTDTQDPARVEIIGSANQVWGREGIRVTAVKVGGTTRNVTAFYRDSKRGS